MKTYKRCKIAEIGKVISGATPKTAFAENYGGDIPWITPADLSGNSEKYISHGARNITAKGYDSCSTQMMPAGTVLFSSRAPIGYVAIARNPICTNQGFKSIVPNPDIDSEFLYYQLKYLRNQIQNMGSGTTFKEISAKVLADVSVVVPPIDEQKRIVARIEELFSELDNGVETLRKTKQQLAVYRQAVLKDIFNGAMGCKTGTIQSVCSDIVDCPHSTPRWVSDGKICLRTTNFKRGYLDLSEKNYVSEETFDKRNTRLVPQPGDVLYSREGAILGIACIIPDDMYVCLGQRMMLLRANDKMLGRFLMHYLNSPRVTSFVTTKIGGSASPHVNVGDIKEFVVPIPTIFEQQKMVEQIESRLSVCESIEKAIDTTLWQADAMRQSILKQAFERTC